ncbi:hypothetical protein DL98DRAFT_654744 [Cadophora sp. DSE1049]|nr:hypothetical protein DL98DRAFT_654744 [Cadophora sp. DSE1049]
MDPLTAFSVAGTVIQFVDFSSKLLLGAHGLYKSTSGVLTANQELELVTAGLRGKLQESFFEIRDSATRLATELMTKLERLKVREDLKGHQRAWASLFKAVECAWTRDELHEMRLKLKTLKEAMESSLLFSLREKFDLLAFQMSERFDALDRQSQYIISALVEERKISASRFSYDALEQTATLSQLHSRLELQNQQEHRRTRAMIAGYSGREIVASTETLEVARDEEAEFRKLVGNKILESLRYPMMSQRFEEVSEAHVKTFNWIFDEKEDEQQVPWTNFANWLQNGEGLYWLKGKAGSGKSTLMNSFFFWNSGTWEQKSQQGLFRALLFQVFNDKPDLIPIVLPLTWSRTYTRLIADKAGLVNESWSLRSLKDGFKLLVKQNLVPLKLCFFIDGLDEFDGDHEDMAELFKDITSPTVKDCPGLRLQDLTRQDIELYVREILAASPAFQRLAKRNPTSTTSFVEETVEKADGVVLVVRSLLNGIRNRDSIPDLLNRLRGLPRELEPLYDHLLERIEPGYYPWASKVFQIMKLSQRCQAVLQGRSTDGPEPLSILSLYLAMDDSLELETVQKWTLLQMNGICEDTAFQLTARRAGLLETRHSGDLTPESKVYYLHRTAQEYLAQRTVWDDLLSHASSTVFNPDVALLRSYVLRLGVNHSHPTNPSNWPYKTAHYALFHAHFAEKEPVKAPSKSLDDLNTIMTACAKSSIRLHFSHWSNDITKRRALQPATSFVQIATIYGLISYVDESGITTQVQPGVEPAPLLHFAVPVDSSDRNFPLPQPKMVEVLLNKKANANLAYNNITPWQQALAYARGQQERGDTWEEQALLLEILTLMLNHGADPWTNIEVERHIYSVQKLLHGVREDRNVLPREDKDAEVRALSSAVDKALNTNVATGNVPIDMAAVKKSRMRHIRGWLKGSRS